MDDHPDPEPRSIKHAGKHGLQRLRSMEFMPTRSRVTNTIIILAGMLGTLFLAYRLFFPPNKQHPASDDLKKQISQVLECAAIERHEWIRISGYEHQESIIFRTSLDSSSTAGPSDRLLFSGSIHGVARIGVPSTAVLGSLTEDDASVHVLLPKPTVIEANVVSCDTRLTFPKGSVNEENGIYKKAANDEGTVRIRAIALEDSSTVSSALQRTRLLLTDLIARNGKKAVFD